MTKRADLKFCVNCKHYVSGVSGGPDKCFGGFDLVLGQRVEQLAITARMHTSANFFDHLQKCGPGGALFEPKDDAAKKSEWVDGGINIVVEEKFTTSAEHTSRKPENVFGTFSEGE
jgi:hypothetical protein